VAIAVSGLLFGLIARSAGGTISGSSVQVLSRLGSRGNDTDAVLGVCFLVLAVLVAFAGAGQITAARSEESAGRLDQLLTRPVSRSRWLGGRLLVTIGVLLASGVMAGVFAWAGAASQHAGVSLATLAGAGVNLVPPAVTIAGIGVLALGVWPRGTSIVLYALLAWSLLVVVIGGIGAISHWVLDTSVFHQMASAPAVPPHWEADGVMAAIGVVGALIGGIAFKRRDLRGE
jgi:ABC-2 type transport system permease protein